MISGTRKSLTGVLENCKNDALVNNLYQQMFGRDAEPEGLSFWVGLIENNEITLSSAAIEILNGANGNDIDVFANKLEGANYFSAAIDTEAEQQQYQDDQAADNAAELLASVTDSPETLARMKAVVEAAYGKPGAGVDPDDTDRSHRRHSARKCACVR